MGSSMKTSSSRVVFWMARSMEGVGVVTTSPVVEEVRCWSCRSIRNDGGRENERATHCGNRKQQAQDPPKHFASCALPQPI